MLKISAHYGIHFSLRLFPNSHPKSYTKRRAWGKVDWGSRWEWRDGTDSWSSQTTETKHLLNRTSPTMICDHRSVAAPKGSTYVQIITGQQLQRCHIQPPRHDPPVILTCSSRGTFCLVKHCETNSRMSISFIAALRYNDYRLTVMNCTSSRRRPTTLYIISHKANTERSNCLVVYLKKCL